MIILSTNQFLKIGIKEILSNKKKPSNIRTVIFDAGKNIYILHESVSSWDYLPDIFFVLTSGNRLSRNEIKETDTFCSYIISCCEICDLTSIRKRPEELTKTERIVINALLSGHYPLEVATLLKKSIKTVSCQKSRALRKLGVNTLQELHKVLTMWELATYRLGYNFSYHNIIVEYPL